MKFMKLGSRPDTFYSTEAVRYFHFLFFLLFLDFVIKNGICLFKKSSVIFLQSENFDVHILCLYFWYRKIKIFCFWSRSVSSEVSSDLTIQVKGSRYLLHKVSSLKMFLHFWIYEWRFMKQSYLIHVNDDSCP